jgi:hypothetical protein
MGRTEGSANGDRLYGPAAMVVADSAFREALLTGENAGHLFA